MQHAKFILLLFTISFFVSCGKTNQKNTRQIQSMGVVANKPYFILFSDVHLNSLRTDSDYGFDTGTKLFDAAMQSIYDLMVSSNPPQFVLFTGDLPAHLSITSNICAHTKPINAGGLVQHERNDSIVLNTFYSKFKSTGIPFLYLPGNNDGLNGDYYPFTGPGKKNPLGLLPNNSVSYPTLNLDMDTTKSSFIVNIDNIDQGYYSVEIGGGLIIIALNSIMFCPDYQLADNLTKELNRKEQMDWLSAQLKNARTDNKKVIIGMHIPPGIDAHSSSAMWDSSTQNWETVFLGIVQEYQQEITNLFYSHTHMDEFRRLYDTLGTKVTEIAYSSPGISPVHCNNPGYKVVYYDATNYVVEDMITHYTIPDTNMWLDSTYSWKSEFNISATQTLQTILQNSNLNNLLPPAEKIYTVFNNQGSDKIRKGIEVK